MHRWQYTLREYVYPRLGAKAVDEVTTADVMAVLLPIWTRKHATAQQVRQRIGTVMKWAIAQGYRGDNPAAEAVTAALPKRPVPTEHRRALPHAEVAGAVCGGVRLDGVDRREAGLRVSGVDRGAVGGGASGDVGGDRPGQPDLGDSGLADEDRRRSDRSSCWTG